MSNPAETYEAFMVPVLFSPWASRLIQSANPQSGENVLDIGCGTGIVSRQVAARPGWTGRIIGLDSSPHMLSVARAISAREGLNINWKEGRAEELPFPEQSFDLVLSQFALMFFSDTRSAVLEMRRVLKDSGRLLFSVWKGLDYHPFYQKLHNVIEKRFGMSGVQQIFAFGEQDRLRELLLNAGFSRVTIEEPSMTARFPNPETFLAGEIDVDTAAIPSMQNLDPGERKSILAAISDEMKKPLADVVQDDHVILPFHAHIVRASS